MHIVKILHTWFNIPSSGMFLLNIVLDDGCDGTAGSTIPLLVAAAAVDLYRINLSDVCWAVVDDIMSWWSDGDVVLTTAWAVIDDAARRLRMLLGTFHIVINKGIIPILGG